MKGVWIAYGSYVFGVIIGVSYAMKWLPAVVAVLAGFCLGFLLVYLYKEDL